MVADKDFAAPPARLPFRRPPWPFRTRAWRRVRWLLLAPLLPLMMSATLELGLHMVVEADPNDHAIVWVGGSERALLATGHAVAAHAVFAHGRRAGPRVFDEGPPAACPAGAEAFVFSRLHGHEARLAADELRALAAKAGAKACGGDMFIFDDVPALGAPGALADNLLHVAWLAGVPLLAVLLLPWGLGERLELRTPWAWSGWRPRPLGLGLAVGLGLLAVLWPLRLSLQALGWAPMSPGAMTGLPAGIGSALLLFVLLPFLQEAAYRGWALPMATRTLGPRLALGVPILVAAAINPPGLHAWPTLVVTHLSLGLLLQRTGSIAPCIVANMLFSTGWMLLP